MSGHACSWCPAATSTAPLVQADNEGRDAAADRDKYHGVLSRTCTTSA